MSSQVVVPRINANEDQLLLVDVLVTEGAQVEKGQLLFVVESTKAASEILAPQGGQVSALAAVKGTMVDVGAQLCLLTGEGANADREQATTTADAQAEICVTAKAKLVAARLGIDITQVPPVDGKVGAEEVEAFAATRKAVSAPIPAQRAFVASSLRGTAVIIGGGGHAAALIDALQGSGYRIVGCTDPAMTVGTHVAGGVHVIGGDDLWSKLKADGVMTAFVGVGGATSNTRRREVYEAAIAAGFSLPPIVARSAVFGIDAELGPASYVLPGAVVGPRCTIGSNVLINAGSIVCHDSVIGDHAHIAPGAVLAGSVVVGELTTIGMAATVLFQAKIGRNCIVHNGAAVTGDISDNVEFSRSSKRSHV